MSEAVKASLSVDLLFEKPVEAEQLASRIEKILQERATERDAEDNFRTA
jgi:FixJ family two-component response regulator